MKLIDHIGIFEAAVPSDICDSIVAGFDVAESLNFSYSRQASEGAPTTVKKDQAVNVLESRVLEGFALGLPNIGRLQDAVWSAYHEYTEEYDFLKTSPRHVISGCKLQKTVPSGGYHVWHFEASGFSVSGRLATYIVYLNDVAEGGETEFLYQQLRIAPKKGTIVIFPATYTHIHRGNPPLKGNKYIATNWFEFVEG